MTRKVENLMKAAPALENPGEAKTNGYERKMCMLHLEEDYHKK